MLGRVSVSHKFLPAVSSVKRCWLKFATSLPRMELLNRYADIPMDFADACVVRLAELHTDATVCTTDSDFRIFRKHSRESIPLLAPFTS